MDQIDQSGPNWIALNKTKVERNTKLNRLNVKSGIDGYGLSSWIQGQLVLQCGAVMPFCGQFWCDFCSLCGLVNTLALD